jgi:hypothetical protein
MEGTTKPLPLYSPHKCFSTPEASDLNMQSLALLSHL